MTESALGNPILNSPYDAPERHFELGRQGPTGTVLPGRRLSESFIPIPLARKAGKGAGGADQDAFDFDITGERREDNSLINDVRRQVELWRGRRYPWVTPMSRKLLEHWAGGEQDREDRMLFCQREAAETAIYLAEVRGDRGDQRRGPSLLPGQAHRGRRPGRAPRRPACAAARPEPRPRPSALRRPGPGRRRRDRWLRGRSTGTWHHRGGAGAGRRSPWRCGSCSPARSASSPRRSTGP